MKVYVPQTVRKIRNYYGSTLFDYKQTIFEKIERHSQLLWNAVECHNDVVLNEINNYHPDYIGKSWQEIMNSTFSRSDVQTAVLRQYGFRELHEVRKEPLNAIFENIVDIMLEGNLSLLRRHCEQYPECIVQKSQFGHEATLLHYLANNGLELYRQVVPYNLKSLFMFLIKNGADVNAKMKVYGGQHTFIDLFASSIHPYDAGVREDFIGYYNDL